MTVRIIHGDCRSVLPTLEAGSVQCCVTSPPYFGLRDYQVAGQIGLEKTPDEYIAELVSVFRGVRRVLRDDGTLWLNLGDSYARDAAKGGSGPNGKHDSIPDYGNARRILSETRGSSDGLVGRADQAAIRCGGAKPKDLLMIPARVALALQADGWWLRSDIIWHKCLSGGTRVYARTQKGEMPMSIKDMVRLDPATVQLWNGEKWTQAVAWSETPRPDRTYEIELRNGQRIGCTAEHVWPTMRGDVRTDAMNVGDIIRTCRLPEPPAPKRPASLDDDMVGWFIGLYIAEGSQSSGAIQIASHTREDDRFNRLKEIATAFHGTIALHKTSENGCTINLYSPILLGIIDTYVSGRIASDKHLNPRCWQRSDAFLLAVVSGYLSGDGHWDAKNERWRLGFCNNDELVADLRTAGARLGISVRLKRVMHKIGDTEFPGYKGELRMSRSLHFNSRDDGEVVAIRESRARRFWDISVADNPNLFALASGVLTHNSNPMPESVTDRPTSAHEHVFLLTKAARYYYNSDAIRERASAALIEQVNAGYNGADTKDFAASGAQSASGTKSRIIANARAKIDKQRGHCRRHDGFNDRWDAMTKDEQTALGSNARNVWTIATKPYSGSHFATMPPELAERCIKAGSKPGDTILDPFGGAGTTGLVADRLRRRAVLIELNPAYADMGQARIVRDAPLFAGVGP